MSTHCRPPHSAARTDIGHESCMCRPSHLLGDVALIGRLPIPIRYTLLSCCLVQRARLPCPHQPDPTPRRSASLSGWRLDWVPLWALSSPMCRTSHLFGDVALICQLLCAQREAEEGGRPSDHRGRFSQLGQEPASKSVLVRNHLVQHQAMREMRRVQSDTRAMDAVRQSVPVPSLVLSTCLVLCHCYQAALVQCGSLDACFLCVVPQDFSTLTRTSVCMC